MTWRSDGIGSYRYGSRVLWTVDADLAGSRARSFSGRVELFFRSEESELLVDLRQTGLVDSAGAAALAQLRSAHPRLRVIGPPASWDDFPLAVRCSLFETITDFDLESALTQSKALPATPERRRHPRIPLQLPVELFYAGQRVPAALQDISRGGVRLSVDPDLCETRLSAEEAFDILGLEGDPLGRELICAGPGPVRVACVRIPAETAVGASFADSPPPD